MFLVILYFFSLFQKQSITTCSCNRVGGLVRRFRALRLILSILSHCDTSGHYTHTLSLSLCGWALHPLSTIQHTSIHPYHPTFPHMLTQANHFQCGDLYFYFYFSTHLIQNGWPKLLFLCVFIVNRNAPTTTFSLPSPTLSESSDTEYRYPINHFY